MSTPQRLDSPADIRLTVDQSDPLAALETELALLQRALERLGRRSGIHRELDRASYLVARTLEATGPISLRTLSSRLGLDATTVTRQVAGMEASGLVLRHADPNDGRVNLIELSATGLRRMRAVNQARQERLRHLVAGWSQRDQRELGRLLRRFNDAISDTEHQTHPPMTPDHPEQAGERMNRQV